MAIFGRRKSAATMITMPKASKRFRKSASANVTQSLNKTRKPFDHLRLRGIYSEERTDEELKEIRQLCRDYYKFHDLIPMIITIYAKFPLQGMRIVCRNAEEQKLFEEQFFNKLKYKSYLVEVGKEFFKVGEANSFAIFDYNTNEWISEEIIDPDHIYVDDSIFAGDEEVSMEIPEQLMEAANAFGTPEHTYLKTHYPDIVDAVENDRRVNLNKDFIHRIVEKADPWDTRGTPMLTRAFDSLLREETLNAAQDAIADRLYSPLILARLGLSAGELGEGQQPWIPSQADLNDFSETLDAVMSADFRALVHHFGLNINSVFGRESMPNLSNDFERVERKIMRAFGIGPSLLDGSNTGAYASSAINRDFVSQIMSSYQDQMKDLFKKRAEVFSRSRKIYEVETVEGGEDSVVKDKHYKYHADGTYDIEEVPRPFIPDIEFASDPLKDASFEVNLLLTLRDAGVPVSDEAIIDAADRTIDSEVELERINNEKVEKHISEIRSKIKLDKRLRELDLEDSRSSGNLYDLQQTGQRAQEDTNTYKPSEDL